MLCLVGSVGGGLAEPLLSDPDRDPRTAGSLPPQAEAATAAPLRPSLELPGGRMWLRGEVPSGALDPHGAVRGASASLGVRLPVTVAEGVALETSPTLTGSASAATHPGVSSLSPGIGFALAQTISLALPMGLRLATEAALGDRLGIFGAAAAAAATPVASGEPPLAMRAGATLSTDLDVPFADARVRVGFGVSTTGGLALGGAGSNRPYEPSDCRLSLDIGRVGGAPLRVSAPCTQNGLAATPISFGFKTEF